MKPKHEPKHWDGYNSLGGKMAKQLDAVGLPYLKKSTHAGTLTRKHDNMYTVTGGVEEQFFSSGRARINGITQDRHVESPTHVVGFYEKETMFRSFAGERWGYGIKIDMAQIFSEFVPIRYVIGEQNIDTLWRTRSYPTRPIVTFGNIRRDTVIGFEVPFSVTTPHSFVTHPGAFLSAAPQLFPLQHFKDGEAQFFVITHFSGQQADLRGAPATTPIWYVYDSREQSTPGFLFPNTLLPAANRRSIQNFVPTCVVGPGSIYVLLMHNWTLPRDDEIPLTPVARLLFTTDSAAHWSVRDVTSLLFEDTPWVPLTAAAQRHPATYGLRWYYSINLIAVTAHTVAIGNGEAIFTHVYERQHPDDPTRTSGELRSRVYLMSGGHLIRIGQSEEIRFWYFQDMVYMGANILIAKKTYGYNGANFDIEFVVSYDRGVTWNNTNMEGLPNPAPNRKNRFFGNMTVLEGISERWPQGIVILPAYDPDEKAYRIYESRDLGQTWKKRGVLSRTETFFRVDRMVVGDGGGNFHRVYHAGSRARPAVYNPAIPDLLG